MNRPIAIILVGLVLLGNAAAWGDPGWVVTREDFREQPVSLEGIDDNGVRVLAVGEKTPVAG
ncbi:MAG TPA: hypothetical protein VHP11_13550 [Tepidisphaeraceae bacterium]|nr:hypothetical protein [Tepidisphaeraceae bacterium]